MKTSTKIYAAIAASAVMATAVGYASAMQGQGNGQ